MNNRVEYALNAALTAYAKVNSLEEILIEERLKSVFNLETHFLEKVKSFDVVFDDFPAFEELREVFFDLLMINFFTSDVNLLEADYLESAEWEKIEDQTIERGTELLNLLLYINECNDEGIKPALEDFLKEFLLVEEDEFQDEFQIYEDLISHQQLAESSVEEICYNANILSLGEEMEALFVPFMVFFHQPSGDEKTMQDLQKYSNHKGFDVSVYTLITTFSKK